VAKTTSFAEPNIFAYVSRLHGAGKKKQQACFIQNTECNL
jgi:hypothetical protein